MAARARQRITLLAPGALAGVRLGISVSESPDLLRLGLLETHFRLALAEIARCVIVSGGHLAYGGHLQPEGYTSFLVHELERYSRRDRPLHVCLAWTEHRKLTLAALKEEETDLGLLGKIIYLDVDGNVIDPSEGRGDAIPVAPDADTTRRGLTGLRHYVVRHTQGRVLIGGKREGFQGEMPGLLQEALFAVERGQPLYLAGGFGGMTWTIARQLDVDDGRWFPELGNTPQPERPLAEGLERLAATAKATKLRSLENGLSPAENRRLSVSHRPSEIAALVSLGLGRRFPGRE